MSKNKKLNSVLLITIVLLIFFCIYYLLFSKDLQIEVYNKTNHNIDSLEIDNKYYNIEKGKSLVIKDCKKIFIQDGLPFGVPNGIIRNKQIDTTQFVLFGTGIEAVTEGKYKFDIKVLEDQKFYILSWEEHKPESMDL
ncbi:hypothetical protein [Flavobacterium hydatis]|nr:hypothetical protein [Flavobacterium hydatis]KFF15632.1 hypothetical protein IW20_13240 [Flavobacterium hydatis]